jgi:hypothetical protein
MVIMTTFFVVRGILPLPDGKMGHADFAVSGAGRPCSVFWGKDVLWDKLPLFLVILMSYATMVFDNVQEAMTFVAFILVLVLDGILIFAPDKWPYRS